MTTRKRGPTSSAEIIKAARHHRRQTQSAFAADIGRSQAEISRYESGHVDPPGAVLMFCLEEIGMIGQETTVSVKQLTDRIRRDLKPASKQKVRAAVWNLLDLAQHR